MTKEEAVARLEKAEADLAKLRKRKGSGAKTEEDLASREDYSVFTPGTLRSHDSRSANVVDVVCMLADPDGLITLERDYRPLFKSGPRKGEVYTEFCLDKGTTICGRPVGEKATSDLQWVNVCEDHKADRAATVREARGEYTTKATSKLIDEIAELNLALEGMESEVDLD